MKANCFFKTTHRALRDFLLCLWLWIIAVRLPVSVMGQANYATPYTFTTFAGEVENPGTNEETGVVGFYQPTGVAADSTGNVYVADTWYNAIRKISAAGVVTTLAGVPDYFASGSADGTGNTAQFNNPSGVAVDSAGNVYVADTFNCTIRKVTPAGVVTTLAGMAGSGGNTDGTNSGALFKFPQGVAVDSTGNLYVADTQNDTIRQMTAAGTNWVVTTLAGLAGNFGTNDGTGSAARFNYPSGVAVDTDGNVFVADTFNNSIRELTPVRTNWVVTKLAGGGDLGSSDGIGSAARLIHPCGLALDKAGSVYVANTYDNTIRKITPTGTNWVVTTLAGLGGAGNGVVGSVGSADGTGIVARFNESAGVAVDSTGTVYVADTLNCIIRKGFLASSVPAPILQPPSLNAGQFGFGISGLPNLTVDIQSSADLSHWQVVGTYVLDGGSNYFVSPTTPKSTQFYRAHVR